MLGFLSSHLQHGLFANMVHMLERDLLIKEGKEKLELYSFVRIFFFFLKNSELNRLNKIRKIFAYLYT